MSVQFYKRRRLHDQRRFDALYLTASGAAIAFAVRSPGSAVTLTFSLFLPLVCMFLARNESIPMFSWRVAFWKEKGILYRTVPTLITTDVALRIALLTLAIPAVGIGTAVSHWSNRALWTFAFLAVFTTLSYTALGAILSAFGSTVFTIGVIYVLAWENVLCHVAAWPRWMSVREWAESATHVLPTDDLLQPQTIPTAAGWVLTYAFLLFGLVWSSGNLLALRWRKTGEMPSAYTGPSPSAPPTPPGSPFIRHGFGPRYDGRPETGDGEARA